MPLSNVIPENYPQQLQAKADRITARFREFQPPQLEVYASPPLHFRQRAEFRVWHQGDDCFCVMFHPDAPKTPVRIDRFPIGSERLNDVLGAVMSAVRQSAVLRTRLFQLELLTTLSGEALVTLIYHRKLDDAWEQAATALQSHLNINIIGRSRKQKLVLSQDYVTEALTVENRQYLFQQVENSFTQPNAEVNQKMLSWALRHSKDSQGDLLELYCGNGNFTAVLADNFRNVLATEISKTSVKSARLNFEMNKVANVEILRMSSEELTAAFNQERAFRRLANIDLPSYHFSTVLVDPPRAGLDKATEDLVGRFQHILYISCNPDTLYNNLNTLSTTHRVTQFAIFDQFPYTDHIECGVKLEKL